MLCPLNDGFPCALSWREPWQPTWALQKPTAQSSSNSLRCRLALKHPDNRTPITEGAGHSHSAWRSPWAPGVPARPGRAWKPPPGRIKVHLSRRKAPALNTLGAALPPPPSDGSLRVLQTAQGVSPPSYCVPLFHISLHRLGASLCSESGAFVVLGFSRSCVPQGQDGRRGHLAGVKGRTEPPVQLSGRVEPLPGERPWRGIPVAVALLPWSVTGSALTPRCCSDVLALDHLKSFKLTVALSPFFFFLCTCAFHPFFGSLCFLSSSGHSPPFSDDLGLCSAVSSHLPLGVFHPRRSLACSLRTGSALWAAQSRLDPSAC